LFIVYKSPLMHLIGLSSIISMFVGSSVLGLVEVSVPTTFKQVLSSNQMSSPSQTFNRSQFFVSVL